MLLWCWLHLLLVFSSIPSLHVHHLIYYYYITITCRKKSMLWNTFCSVFFHCTMVVIHFSFYTDNIIPSWNLPTYFMKHSYQNSNPPINSRVGDSENSNHVTSELCISQVESSWALNSWRFIYALIAWGKNFKKLSICIAHLLHHKQFTLFFMKLWWFSFFISVSIKH